MSRGLADFPIGEVAIWYLILLACQWAVWPTLYRYAKNLPDRGYSVARSAGLLMSGWLCWSGWVYGVWQFGPASAWFCLAAVAAFGWGPTLLDTGKRTLGAQERSGQQSADPPLSWVLHNLRLVVTIEVVFLLAFAFLLFLRAMLPTASHTEQPSDLMFMNSVAHSPVFPARDAWLAGLPVSYYYFGYWLQVFVGKLGGISPTLTYNLGLASLFALLCCACFGVGYNLVSAGSHTSSYQGSSTSKGAWLLSRGVVGGGLSVALVCLAGNFRTIYDLVRYAGSRSDWWWLSSRAIRDIGLSGQTLPAITEFPAFSFILGDNHPHLQSAPVLVLLILVLLNVFLASDRTGSKTVRRPAGELKVRDRVVLGFLLGALAAINSWDIVAGTLLIGGSVLWSGLRSIDSGSPDRSVSPRVLRALGIDLVAIPLVAFLCFAPHLLTSDADVRGLLPNLLFPTYPADFVAAVGPGWLGLALLFFLVLPPSSRRIPGRWLALAVTAVPVYLGGALLWAHHSKRIVDWISSLGGETQALNSTALLRWSREPFVALGLVASIYLVLRALGGGSTRIRARAAVVEDDPTGPILGFVLILVLAGLALLLLPEFLFLHDAFGNRVNSVFKLHYGAWILIELAGAYGLSWRPHGRIFRNLRTAALLIAAGSLLYPVAAASSRLGQSGWQVHDLDALRSIRDQAPDLYSTLHWIDVHLPPHSAVLESVGRREDPASNRVSVLTGHPTPLGWIDHESQWRSGEERQRMIEERAALVDTTYSARTPTVLERSLRALGVRFVFVGERERKLFGLPEESSIFDESCRCLFRSGPCRVYDCARRSLGPEEGSP
ncbi:MAG: DUF2298 domain-containing protein [Acidobacteriota bacterium]